MATVRFNKDKILADLKKAVSLEIQKSAIEIQTEAKRLLNQRSSNLTSGNGAAPPGEPPANMTGTLMRSITAIESNVNDKHLRWRVGTNVEYAAIHEYGGRITPKKGKYLVIPVGTVGKRLLRDNKGSLRGIGVHFVRNAKGTLLAVLDVKKGQKIARGEKKAKGDHSIVIAVLVRQVMMPRRPYMGPAFRAKKKDAQDRIQNAVKAVLTKYTGA